PELAGRVSFIPTWVDTDVFKPAGASQEREARIAVRHELKVPANSRFLISVGRLDHQKDPLLLLEAFQAVAANDPQLHLLFVGDGVLRDKLATQARGAGLPDRMHLLGAQPG